jgi:hypothetical protein
MDSSTKSFADFESSSGGTPEFDFIVCGSGSSGSVVAGRLAEHPELRVLLLEAGGDDKIPQVRTAGQWPLNLGTERDWNFHAAPDNAVNGRSVPMSMGKVLGGGSSINTMIWAWGHRSDWDYFAFESGDPAWGYDSILDVYRRIEDWHGTPDPRYRGTGGPVFVQTAPDPHPIAYAVVDGAKSLGIPTFDSHNGEMMEGPGGAAIIDLRIRDGFRQSAYRSYVHPHRTQPNLTVFPNALVIRLVMNDSTLPVWSSSMAAGSTEQKQPTRWCFPLGHSTRPNSSCNPASATTPTFNVTAYQSFSIYRAWAKTSRTTSDSTASGNAKSRSHHATTAWKPPTSGEAIRGWTPLICRRARPSFPSRPALRTPSGSTRQKRAGICSPVSCRPRAAGRFY